MVKIKGANHCPEMVHTVLVVQDGYNGVYDKNALALKSNGVSKMKQVVDGQGLGHTYELDFTHDNYAREYMEFLASCNRGLQDVNTFLPSNFKTHRPIFAFDRTPHPKVLVRQCHQ